MAASERVVGQKYRILAEVGKGGMSTVYLALDSTLNKQWAVKEIRHISDKDQRRLVIGGLISEANLIKTFDHPAIPRIVDLIEEDGSLYIVMDYVEGRSLRKVLKEEGPQSEENVVAWGIQLCDVLDYLHRRTPPIVYRDMKPSNVMVTPEGATRVLDFGIACEMPPAEGPLPEGYNASVGTPGFAAPEQYDEFGRCDARTDVYGLGATLYALLVGKDIKGEPYEAPPLRQVLPGASAGLERVLARAMQKDPNQRFQDCAEFAYALEHYSDRDMRLRKTMQIKWRVFCSFCAAAVVLAVAGGATLGVGAAMAASDYGQQMSLAEQASDDDVAEERYVAAANLRPSAVAPYEGLVKRYEANGVFDAGEERELQQVLGEHSDVLSRNGSAWGQLAFDIGKMYWYYYMPSGATRENGTAYQLQYNRIVAASHWMHVASKTDFKDKDLAGLYATIADFNTSIIPLIDEGSDAGRYSPYFKDLTRLMKLMASSNNDVMKLSTANLVLDAARTYPRKFRADGVNKDALEGFVDMAYRLADGVVPTTDKLRSSKNEALAATDPARQAVSEAFVDVTGNGGK